MMMMMMVMQRVRIKVVVSMVVMRWGFERLEVLGWRW